MLEVDRILDTTEIFPVVHPHQAALVINKWQEPCIGIISKLLNYVRDDVPYGIYFLESPDPALEESAHYYSFVKYSIDLGTIHNRLHIGYYERPSELWKDIGMVFKNCQAYFTNRTGDTRIMGDTLRQIAIHLYKQWHSAQDPNAVPAPGRYTLRWVTLVPDVDILDESFLNYDLEAEEFTEIEEEEDKALNEQHLTLEELQAVADATDVDKLYLVKWRNSSYSDSTWEPESVINDPSKIANFMKFNRSLDTQSRKDMTNLTNNFYRVIN